MKGHGEKPSRTEDRAILALLAEPTLERAAKKCGIGVTTLKWWLQEPAFQRQYCETRRTVFKTAHRNGQDREDCHAAGIR